MKRNRAPKGGCTVAGKFYKGGQFLPALKPPNKLAETLAAITEVMIYNVEANDLPPDVGYSRAMGRILVYGRKPTVKDIAALDRRRRAAIGLLADHPDPLVRRHFAGLLAAYPNM